MLTAAAACGSKTRIPARALEEPPSAAESQLAEAMCDYLTRCEPDAMGMFTGGSRQGCEEYFGCSLHDQRWPNAVMLGDELSTCLTSLETRSCSAPEGANRFSGAGVFLSFPWGAACGVEQAPPDDFEGTAKRGAACVAPNGEQPACERGDYCQVEDEVPTFGSVYCGTCAARAAVGASCNAAQPCIEEARCVDGRCALPLEAGAFCTAPNECRYGECDDNECGADPRMGEPVADVLGRACTSNDDCGAQAALFCSYGVCARLPDEGERCSADECRLGLYCLAEHCVALGCNIDVGEPCETWCTTGECVAGVCEPAPDQVGAPCTLQCAGGLTCISGTCERVDRSNGAACDWNSDCHSWHCERDVSEFCNRDEGCSIPTCGKCGTCAPMPTNAACE